MPGSNEGQVQHVMTPLPYSSMIKIEMPQSNIFVLLKSILTFHWAGVCFCVSRRCRRRAAPGGVGSSGGVRDGGNPGNGDS